MSFFDNRTGFDVHDKVMFFLQIFLFRSGPVVLEFLIQYTDGTFDITSAKGMKFPSMNKLLDYYVQNPLIDKQTDQVVQLKEVLIFLLLNVYLSIKIYFRSSRSQMFY